MTYTFATLAVSKAVYEEIAAKLRDAGYDFAFVDGAIDMHGIGLVVEVEEVPRGDVRECTAHDHETAEQCIRPATNECMIPCDGKPAWWGRCELHRSSTHQTREL